MRFYHPHLSARARSSFHEHARAPSPLNPCVGVSRFLKWELWPISFDAPVRNQMEDPSKILTSIATSALQQDASALEGDAAIRTFVNESTYVDGRMLTYIPCTPYRLVSLTLHCSCMVLRLSLSGTKVVAAVDAAIASSTPASAVYYTKLRPCRLAPGPVVLHDIAISSVPASPLDTMYSAVHGVFAPALLSGGPLAPDDKLRGLLGELDKALSTAVRKIATDASSGGGSGAGGLAGILSVRDEQRYWEDASRLPRERERAQAFARLLEPLSASFDGADGAPPSQLAEIAEDAQVGPQSTH